jgi:Mg2+ transporter MgtE
MLGKPVVDATGSEIGAISDIAIATGEIFPRVTSLAFLGPEKTPFMLSWRKWVEEFAGEQVKLNAAAPDIRFSYLQPDEVLLARDLLNKQIVDTQGKKVVRVNDLKLSESKNQLRLLGAEVGIRGILRGLHPALESTASWIAGLFGQQVGENLIAWNYMDLLDRDLSHVSLSVSHKRLHELHPADVADILEVISPSQRARVFEHLENTQAAEAVAALEDEYQVDVIDDLGNQRAADLLEIMDPDDAADIIGDLPYDKAETLLRLMGVKESRSIRSVLGYKEKTAGGIMTPEVTTVTEDMTVQEVIEFLRGEAAEHEIVYYIFVVEGDRKLAGVVSLRDLIMASPDTKVTELSNRDVIAAGADDDQEDVAETMSKYDLLALPVLDETGKLLGIVTVDDALEVLEEESAEDLEIATGRRGPGIPGVWGWVSRDGWLIVWSLLMIGLAVVARTAESPQITTTLLLTALFMLFVLRVAEDVSAHNMGRVIEGIDDDERPSLWQTLLRDGLSGLGLGLLVGLVFFAASEIALGPEEATSLEGVGVSGAVAVVAAISIVVVTLAGTLLGAVAERRVEEEKRVSHTVMSVALMFVGSATFVALAYMTIELIGGPLVAAR